MEGSLTVKLTVRALPSGEQACVLFIDDPNYARSVAEALVKSEEFGNACVSGVDWRGHLLFEIFPPPDDDDEPSIAPLKSSSYGNVIPFRKRLR